jgi:hypothetical protein
MVKADFFLDLFGNRRSNRLMRMRAGASNDGVFSALKPPS